MGCLYKLTSPSGKGYIGITRKTAGERLLSHVAHMNRGRQFAIHNAIKKYGASRFKVETLLVSDDLNVLMDEESKAIRSHKTFSPHGYNLTAGGEKCDFWNSESHRKRSEGQKRSWKNNYEARKSNLLKCVAAMQKACSNPEIEGARRLKISRTMKAKGVGLGSSNAASILDETDVRNIKSMIRSEVSCASIAKKFNVSGSLVSAIKLGKRWGHVGHYDLTGQCGPPDTMW